MTGEKIPEHEHVWDEHDICIGCPAERPAKTETPEHRCSISPALAAEMEAARDQQSQPDDVLRTATGKVLTDADVQALADEAERGYDPATIRLTSRSGEDIRLTRARAAFEALRNSTHATVLVGLDLLDLAEEQQRSIRLLTEENGALKARLAEAIQSVGEMAPSPTQALLAAARAVLAAVDLTPACWCGSQTHRDAEGVWCYRDINHDVTWQPEAPAERPEEA